jgi:hypothetical protein
MPSKFIFLQKLNGTFKIYFPAEVKWHLHNLFFLQKLNDAFKTYFPAEVK